MASEGKIEGKITAHFPNPERDQLIFDVLAKLSEFVQAGVDGISFSCLLDRSGDMSLGDAVLELDRQDTG